LICPAIIIKKGWKDACAIKQTASATRFMMEVLYEQKKGKKFIKEVFVSYEDPKGNLSGVTGFSNVSESLQEQESSSAWLKSTV
jgi:hypothetical protein